MRDMKTESTQHKTKLPINQATPMKTVFIERRNGIYQPTSQSRSVTTPCRSWRSVANGSNVCVSRTLWVPLLALLIQSTSLILELTSLQLICLKPHSLASPASIQLLIVTWFLKKYSVTSDKKLTQVYSGTMEFVGVCNWKVH